MIAAAWDRAATLVALGGPVVALLLALSVLAAATAIYKLWQFRAAGVGRHAPWQAAMAAWDAGNAPAARAALAEGRGWLGPLLARAAAGRTGAARLDAEAEAGLARLGRGLRLIDAVAQLAPLLGLFGTVIGMIGAFRAMQAAGTQVDPAVLAGGIWVALLTTAVGLAVAIPASAFLTWLEARLDAERVFADLALRTLVASAGTGDA